MPVDLDVRFAIVVAVVVHAALIVLLAPLSETEPQQAAQTGPLQPPTSNPPEVFEIVLFDEPAPAATIESAARPQHASAASAVRGAAHADNLATASAARDATPRGPDAATPNRDYFAMRQPNLSPAQIVDRAPARGEVPTTGGASDGELRPSGRGTYTTDLGGSDWRTRTATARVARDGTVKFENAPDFDIHFAGLGFAGKFNVDDWITRKTGSDPYASAKRVYLDRTRDERARIAEVNRIDDLASAPHAMQRNVQVARAIVDPMARKQALFELWDDVAETGDDALVRAGANARSYLVGAIRSMRPALVFTPDELARLNAHRSSRAVFAPYEW